MKYMPFGLASRAGGAVSGRCALRGLVRRHIRCCEGITVWFDYGGLCGVHPPNFQSRYHEHGYETRTRNHSKYRYRLGVGGPRNRSDLQTDSTLGIARR